MLDAILFGVFFAVMLFCWWRQVKRDLEGRP